MTVWLCPGCHLEVQARAQQVSHRCPSKKNRVVDFVPADDRKDQP
jgi:hypothetical protein